MAGLTDADKRLIAGFLQKHYALLQEYLDENDIDPVEAEQMVVQLKHR